MARMDHSRGLVRAPFSARVEGESPGGGRDRAPFGQTGHDRGRRAGGPL